MIKIVSKKNYLEIFGHAHSSESDDIVCAAVSSVVCGAYIRWKNNENFLLFEDPKKPLVSFLIKDLGKNKNSTEHVEFNFFVFLMRQIYLNYQENIHWTNG